MTRITGVVELTILVSVVYESHHLLVQFVVGVDNAGCIGVDYLEVFAIHNSHDAVACGLRFAGDDAEAFAYQCIHEGGFAHVGVADDVYESCFMHRDGCLVVGIELTVV